MEFLLTWQNCLQLEQELTLAVQLNLLEEVLKISSVQAAPGWWGQASVLSKAGDSSGQPRVRRVELQLKVQWTSSGGDELPVARGG